MKNSDIKVLAELKEKFSKEQEIKVPREVLEDICYYCESMAIYDKLSNYGDFYYKIKNLIK